MLDVVAPPHACASLVCGRTTDIAEAEKRRQQNHESAAERAHRLVRLDSWEHRSSEQQKEEMRLALEKEAQIKAGALLEALQCRPHATSQANTHAHTPCGTT